MSRKATPALPGFRGRPALRRFACAMVLVVLASARASAQEPVQEPVAFSVLGADVLGDARDAATIGVGAFNSVDQNGDGAAAELRLEARLGEKWNGLGPMAGILATTEGSVFGYVAGYVDIRLGRRWYLTPAAGIGAYEEGDGKDLGGVFQFHLGVDLAYHLGNGHRLGVKLTHISNAFIHDRNPGAESLLVTYTIPLGD